MGATVVPLKRLASIMPSNVDKHSVEGEQLVRLCNYVDVYKNERITEAIDFMEATATDAQINRFTLKANDVIVTKDSEEPTDIGIPAYVPSDLPGVVCGYHLAVLRPDQGRLHGGYLHWALQSAEVQAYYATSATGISRYALGIQDLGLTPVHVPSVPEQGRIANFLDEQTARIDALIAEKELLRERVREYEEAEISRLVRTGQHPSSMLRTSSEVMPDVPAGWRVTAFKRAISAIEQGWSPQCESQPAGPGEWGVLKVGCVNKTSFDPTENKALPSTLKPDLTCVLKKGDVLMSRANTRELVGMAALVDDDYPDLLLCDKLYRLKLKPDWLDGGYAVLLLRCDYVRRQIELGASGASSSMQNISQDVVRELVVGLPSLNEQAEIVEAASKVRMTCTVLTGHLSEHINRLREYRSSLISAAVTGQLDLGRFTAKT